MFIPMEFMLYFMGFEDIMVNFLLDYNSVDLNAAVLVLLATAVMYIIVFPLLTAGIKNLVLKTTDENTGVLKDALSGSFSRIHKIIPTMLLYYILVILGMMLIFPGFYYLIIYAFSLQAIVVTDRWGFGAMRESFWIIRGRFFKMAGFLLISLLFYIAANFILGNLLSLIIYAMPASEILIIVIDFVFWICQCYFITVTCVWYINKRNLMPNTIDVRL
jgi:hypothetical protein